jgi:hypothetical protein
VVSAPEKQRRKALAQQALAGKLRYRTLKDMPVGVLTQWAAPYTGGYDRVLRAGEEFTMSPPPGGASMVYCDPVGYRRLHAEFVPLSDRLRFWSYRGYYLCIPLKDIHAHCERIPDEA